MERLEKEKEHLEKELARVRASCPMKVLLKRRHLWYRKKEKQQNIWEHGKVLEQSENEGNEDAQANKKGMLRKEARCIHEALQYIRYR